MTARIAGFVTRAQAGLVPPTSVSRKIDTNPGGAAVHWGGPAVGIADHAKCIRIWRGWQAFHMGTRGWADIAYTGGFCNHGYAFAGRGHGVRTAAQGSNDGNARFHAYVWIGGEGETPSQEALDALDWWIYEGRRVGGNGMEVREHTYFHTTNCPGSVLLLRARALHLKDVPMTQPVGMVPGGAIEAHWKAMTQAQRDALGPCLTAELKCSDGVGRYNDFAGGSIFWHPEHDAHAVVGDIKRAYDKLQRERGVLGYPRTIEWSDPDKAGVIRQDFQYGVLDWTAATRHVWLHQFVVGP